MKKTLIALIIGFVLTTAPSFAQTIGGRYIGVSIHTGSLDNDLEKAAAVAIKTALEQDTELAEISDCNKNCFTAHVNVLTLENGKGVQGLSVSVAYTFTGEGGLPIYMSSSIQTAPPTEKGLAIMAENVIKGCKSAILDFLEAIGLGPDDAKTRKAPAQKGLIRTEILG